MTTPLPRLRRRGFTAVEISMVVTVIAILALMILPLFQNQSEDARVAAANSDIRMFATAMQLANAHTGYYFTLPTLDNTENYNRTTIRASIDVPVVTWNDALTEAERAALANTWHGPYSSFKNVVTPEELVAQGMGFWLRPANVATGGTTGNTATDGPINQQFSPLVGGAVNFRDDQVPVDPWGNPYVYYGPGRYHITNTAETTYNNSLFWSAGPDGLVGDLAADPSVPANLERGYVEFHMRDEPSDDIFRVF